MTARALAHVRRVRVGSLNAPKLEAARGALRAYVPGARVEGASVDSGVADQPVGFDEIARGATTRADRAYELGGCELAVGYEDGLVDLGPVGAGSLGVVNIGCAAVTDGSTTSLGLSSAFAYPPTCADRALRDREPIGDLFDAFWSERRGASSAPGPSAMQEGNIGRLSLGVLPRSEYARHAIVCALFEWLHPDLYPSGPAGCERP